MRAFALLLSLVVIATPAVAQRGRGRGGPPQGPPMGGPMPPADTGILPGGRDPRMADSMPSPEDAHTAQREFEHYRRWLLPSGNNDRPAEGECDDNLGAMCYWYDERHPPAPNEDKKITVARNRLLALLDSVAKRLPGDRWTAGQRVRYYIDGHKPAEAERAARECQMSGPWCLQLLGLALHEQSKFIAAENAFREALSRMSSIERCKWAEVTYLLDETLQQRYRKMTCDDKTVFNERFWWLARPFYAFGPNDARSEFFSRVTMSQAISGSAVPDDLGQGYTPESMEISLRYGWPRAWTKSRSGGGRGAPPQDDITGYESVPAYPFAPSTYMFDNPGASDSVAWSPQFKPVVARYGPSYAKKLMNLTHQSALFRRGDSAVIVVGWDVRGDSGARGPLEVALTTTNNDLTSATTVTGKNDGGHGVMRATGPWGPLLISAEVRAPARAWTARARYGIRPPFAVGARVTLSDLLLFEQGETLPTTLEEASARMLGTLRIHSNQKLGMFWETYGSAVSGENVTVGITVERDDAEEPGFFARQARRLRLTKESEPVILKIGEQTERGLSRTSRGVMLDISTLSKGTYRLLLEVEAAGQFALRAERTIEVVGK